MGAVQKNFTRLAAPVSVVVLLGSLLSQIGPGDALGNTSTALPEEQVRERVDWALRYSDIVVRGTVRFVTKSVVPTKDLYPLLSDKHQYLRAHTVQNVSLRVTGVIKGTHSSEDATIVAPKHLSISSRLKPGDEIIVAGNYNEVINALVVSMTDGLFVLGPTAWVNQSRSAIDPIPYTTKEIVNVVESVDLPALVHADHIALSGEVEDVVSRDIANSELVAKATTLRVFVTNVFRGDGISEKVSVECREIYAPKRSAPTPNIARGEVWYFLLRKVGGHFEPVDGPNSVFRYERGVLLYNGRTPYTHTPQSFEKSVSEARPRGCRGSPQS